MPSPKTLFSSAGNIGEISTTIRAELRTNRKIISSVSRTSKKPVYLSRGLRKRKLILMEVNVTRAVDLTPKAKKLYRIVSDWGDKMARMRRSVTSFQTRLAQAERCANSPHFEKLMQYVNESTYNFILCQIRNQQLHPKGRRYSTDEKFLALSILKASGRGYRLLSKIFALHSKRTLTDLLNKIPFNAGINKEISENLRIAVQKMNAQEKCCILMFDEISIECSINYNKKDDCIMGLEDSGCNRKAALADHANVFLVKGLYRQWRQPICFTFSSGPVKSSTLKNMIKAIIKECQNIGLDVYRQRYVICKILLVMFFCINIE